MNTNDFIANIILYGAIIFALKIIFKITVIVIKEIMILITNLVRKIKHISKTKHSVNTETSYVEACWNEMNKPKNNNIQKYKKKINPKNKVQNKNDFILTIVFIILLYIYFTKRL